jgi:broad specificity phosphatase PhoE
MADRPVATGLCMVRHAQTLANSHGQYLDDSDSLSPTGELQATLLARRLHESPIGLIVHSGSRRTIQTAAAVAALKPEMTVVEDPRLHEGQTGEWTGQPLGKRREEALRLGIPVWLLRPPGGESWLDIDQRVSSFLEDLILVYGAAHSLIVGQGRVIP